MKSGKITAAIVVLATAAWAQTALPSTSGMPSPRRAAIATTEAESKAAQARADSAMHQRVREMGTTLSSMHALLKQMSVKNATSGTKDPIVKDNIQMWELMLKQLDKQFEQLQAAAKTREDMEARRNAMYKQAEEKAALAARNAMSQQAGGQTTEGAGTQSSPAPAATSPSAQPSSSSPN